MKLTALIPMLESDDLSETLRYYTEVLGFSCTDAMPDQESPFWLSLQRDGVSLMFTDRNAHTPHPRPTLTGVLYFYPDDVAAWWKALKDTAQVEWPLQTFDYGMREFAIRDCHGYLLSFGQAVNM